MHPGEMGASVGAAAVGRGHPVAWASAGRSAASRRRAGDAGLVDAGDLPALLAGSAVVLSIVPPESALAVAEQVAGHGFGGIYVDANAVAPATAQRIGELVAAGGARFVDGGIIGNPVGSPGGTRLYLAGEPAATVAALFEGSGLAAVVLAGPPGAASALKCAYAGWTKGSAALVLAMRALARAAGVEQALLDECAGSLPDLAGRTDRAAASAAAKAWRWAGEMDQIAAAAAGHGLPGGFHQAAADLYRRIGPPADHPTDAVIDLITGPPAGPDSPG